MTPTDSPNPNPRSSEPHRYVSFLTRWLVMIVVCMWIAKSSGAWDLVHEHERYRLLLIPFEAAGIATVLCDLYPALGRMRFPEPIGVITCPLTFAVIAYVTSTLVTTTSSSLTVSNISTGPEAIWQIPQILGQVILGQMAVFAISALARRRR